MKEDPLIKFFRYKSQDQQGVFLRNVWRRCCILLLLITFFVACEQRRKELIDKPHYDGPIASSVKINTLISDSGRIFFHYKAAIENTFERGDREWPEGFFLEAFDKEGAITTTFIANYVYYTEEENIYRAEGNVIVESQENGDKLNTEELFWNPKKEEFYTEKFVSITSGDEVHTGEGMTADQNFSSYRILKPNGTFTLEDDEKN